jgi:hypothetical protein
MLIKCAAEAKAGDELMSFPLRLNQEYLQQITGGSEERLFQAKIREISSEIISPSAAAAAPAAEDAAAAVPVAADPPAAVLPPPPLPNQKLTVTVDFPVMPGNTVSFLFQKVNVATFESLSKKFVTHQNEKIDTKFAFLEERPHLGMTLTGTVPVYRNFLTLPPRSSYLCNNKQFFTLLGFEDVKDYTLLGQGWHGFLNPSTDTVLPIEGNDVETYSKETLSFYGIRKHALLDTDIPDTVKFLVIMEDYSTEVTFDPGLSLFGDYSANFNQALSEALVKLNIKPEKVVATMDGQKIRLIHMYSPQEISFTLTIELTGVDGSVSPVQFEDPNNVLDFDTQENVFSTEWTLPEIEAPPAAAAADADADAVAVPVQQVEKIPKTLAAKKLEDFFPLTIVQAGGTGQLGYVHGSGLLQVLAMVDRRGRLHSEYFKLPSLHSPLVLYFVANDGKIIPIPRNMNIYLTLRVL